MEDVLFRYAMPTAPYAVEDCAIRRIELADNQITFYFPDGVLTDDRRYEDGMTPAAKLVMTCDPADVLCSLYSRHGLGKTRWNTARFPDFEEVVEEVNHHQCEIRIDAFWLAYESTLLRGNFRNKRLEIEFGAVKDAFVVLDD